MRCSTGCYQAVLLYNDQDCPWHVPTYGMTILYTFTTKHCNQYSRCMPIMLIQEFKYTTHVLYLIITTMLLLWLHSKGLKVYVWHLVLQPRVGEYRYNNYYT